MPRLVIRENGEERAIDLVQPEVTIGRASRCDIRIFTEQASRQHCKLVFSDGAYRVLDNGSSNGTTVNGVPIREQVLRSGDVIQIGATTLIYRDDAPPVTEQTVLESTTGSVPIADRSIQILLETLVAAGRTTDLEPFQRLAVDNVIRIARAERGVLYLLDDSNDLKPCVARNSAGENLTDLEKLSRSIPRQVLETGRAIYHLDSEGGEEEVPTVSMKMYKLRTVMCAPLRVGGKMLGTLYVDSQAAGHEYTAIDLSHFEVVTGYLSLTIENLRAAEKAEKAKQQRQKLLEGENQRLRAALQGRRHLVGACPAMQEVYATLRKAAPTEATILILGESGTGKEAIAHALHDLSPRSDKPFVVVDCAAIPETLLESELFGYERGAFTGAVASKEGRFEAADGGTLFLDEIGELGINLQVKLLRALEQRTISRVGSVEPRHINVRIVAATNRDLEAAVRKNEFRQDLLFRLKVIELTLPPLRDRGDDILLLADHFLKDANHLHDRSITDFSEEAKAAMRRHRWEGNVRELKHRVEQAVILSSHLYLSTEDLNLADDSSPTRSLEAAREAFEKTYILKTLRSHSDHVTHTAQALEISRQHLQTLIKKYGISKLSDSNPPE